MTWLRNTDGKPDSALTLKAWWHLVCTSLVAWFAFADRVDPLWLLGFAATMAGMEGAAYVVRRGQEARVRAAEATCLSREGSPPSPRGGVPFLPLDASDWAADATETARPVPRAPP